MEQKTVRMRKYQRSMAKAVMEREGVCHKNRRGYGPDGAKADSYFAKNWKESAKCILKRKKA